MPKRKMGNRERIKRRKQKTQLVYEVFESFCLTLYSPLLDIKHEKNIDRVEFILKMTNKAASYS